MGNNNFADLSSNDSRDKALEVPQLKVEAGPDVEKDIADIRAKGFELGSLSSEIVSLMI